MPHFVLFAAALFRALLLGSLLSTPVGRLAQPAASLPADPAALVGRLAKPASSLPADPAASVGRLAQPASSLPADPANPVGRLAKPAYFLPAALVGRLAQPAYSPTADLPPLPDNDLLLPPDLAHGADAAGARLRTAASPYQTSEYMLGAVQVDVFLPESNGQIDPQTETWTPTQIAEVTAKVTQGLHWWVEAAAQGGRPPADLDFHIDFHTPLNAPDQVATAYEPIQRPHWEEALWMEEILTRLGYPGSHYEAARRYAHDRRTAAGREWAFSIWVINSAADPDGRFSSGYFAYSYLYGPFFVLTYDNDGWTPARLDIVAAHETGHIFGALDEYAASGCTDQQISGYLGVSNTNCENGDPAAELSIMRSSAYQLAAYPQRLASTPVRGMVGWRDLDGDGRYDPVDTVPSLSLAPLPEALAAAAAPPVSGRAEDTPWASPARFAVSINAITAVRYRLDRGPWIACAAEDGRFDQAGEAYRCLPEALPFGGPHTLELQAVNRAGNASPIVQTALVIPGAAPPYRLYLPGVSAERGD